jgi:hypothetical protein
MYINVIQVNINLSTQKMSDIGHIIIDRIKDYFDVDLSFN